MRLETFASKIKTILSIHRKDNCIQIILAIVSVQKLEIQKGEQSCQISIDDLQ